MSNIPSHARHAIILLSGGLDSATCLAIAKSQGFICHALSFQYGQRHAAELAAADALARRMGAVEHKTVTIDLRAFGGSALTDDIDVPKGRDLSQPDSDIPITYVPARNTIFLSFALAFAEVRNAKDIFIGVNALDYSGYPDCRPEFINAFSHMASLATKAGVEGEPYKFHTPLISLTKADIIRTGHELGVDYGMTVSCYDADETGAACGACDSCQLRRKGFVEAGLPDPTRYR